MVRMLGWPRRRSWKWIALPAVAGLSVLSGADYSLAAPAQPSSGGHAALALKAARRSNLGLVGRLLAAERSASGGPAAAGSWRITTAAGGVGGPGPARHIAAGDCAVAFSHGYVYTTGYGYLPF